MKGEKKTLKIRPTNWLCEMEKWRFIGCTLFVGMYIYWHTKQFTDGKKIVREKAKPAIITVQFLASGFGTTRDNKQNKNLHIQRAFSETIEGQVQSSYGFDHIRIGQGVYEMTKCVESRRNLFYCMNSTSQLDSLTDQMWIFWMSHGSSLVFLLSHCILMFYTSFDDDTPYRIYMFSQNLVYIHAISM